MLSVHIMLTRAIIAEASSIRFLFPHKVPLIAFARIIEHLAILDFDLIAGVPLRKEQSALPLLNRASTVLFNEPLSPALVNWTSYIGFSGVIG